MSLSPDSQQDYLTPTDELSPPPTPSPGYLTPTDELSPPPTPSSGFLTPTDELSPPPTPSAGFLTPTDELSPPPTPSSGYMTPPLHLPPLRHIPMPIQQQQHFLLIGYALLVVSFLGVVIYPPESCQLVKNLENLHIGIQVRSGVGAIVLAGFVGLGEYGLHSERQHRVLSWYYLAAMDICLFMFAGFVSLWSKDFPSSLIVLTFAVALVPFGSLATGFEIYGLFDCLAAIIIEFAIKSKKSLRISVALISPVCLVVIYKRFYQYKMENTVNANAAVGHEGVEDEDTGIEQV